MFSWQVVRLILAAYNVGERAYGAIIIILPDIHFGLGVGAI